MQVLVGCGRERGREGGRGCYWAILSNVGENWCENIFCLQSKYLSLIFGQISVEGQTVNIDRRVGGLAGLEAPVTLSEFFQFKLHLFPGPRTDREPLRSCKPHFEKHILLNGFLALWSQDCCWYQMTSCPKLNCVISQTLGECGSKIYNSQFHSFASSDDNFG